MDVLVSTLLVSREKKLYDYHNTVRRGPSPHVPTSSDVSRDPSGPSYIIVIETRVFGLMGIYCVRSYLLTRRILYFPSY